MVLIRVPELATTPLQPNLSTFTRLTCLTLSLGLIVLLATASRLTPAESGLGTHRQLGLPPCSVRMLYGIRCPACGMTTSWAWLVRGQLWKSATVNLGGCCFGLLAIAGIPLLARMAVTGRGAANFTSWFFAISLIAAMAVAVIDWFIRLSV